MHSSTFSSQFEPVEEEERVRETVSEARDSERKASDIN